MAQENPERTSTLYSCPDQQTEALALKRLSFYLNGVRTEVWRDASRELGEPVSMGAIDLAIARLVRGHPMMSGRFPTPLMYTHVVNLARAMTCGPNKYVISPRRIGLTTAMMIACIALRIEGKHGMILTTEQGARDHIATFEILRESVVCDMRGRRADAVFIDNTIFQGRSLFEKRVFEASVCARSHIVTSLDPVLMCGYGVDFIPDYEVMIVDPMTMSTYDHIHVR